VSAPLRHLRQVPNDLPEPTRQPDWAASTADSIERVVSSIRSKTTDPLDRIVRVVVYGLLAGIVGIAALTLLIAALIRALDVAIPGGVWSAHVIVGGIFTVAGLFLWTKRRAPADDQKD
jgi:hypothetical protein